MKQISTFVISFLVSILETFSQTSQPNIIFITIDDCNDWVQGFNGHPQSITPNIRTISKKGTIFTNAYCTAPQCGPSRASMITGKDCEYTQIYCNQDYKCSSFQSNFTVAKGNEEVFTIPGVLKDSAGYYTYTISKVMHCHDELPDYDQVTADPCAKTGSWNKALVFDGFGDQFDIIQAGIAVDSTISEFGFGALPDSLEPEMQDYLATDSAIAFLQNYSDDPSNFCNKPFFLGLGYRRPHGPEYIPEKYFSSFYNMDFKETDYDLPYNFPIGSTPANGIIMPIQPTTPYSDYYALPDTGVAVALIKEHDIHQGVIDWADQYQFLYGFPDFAFSFPSDSLKEEALRESARANMVISYLAAIRYVDAQIGRLYTELISHPELFNNTIIVIVGDHGYSMSEKAHYKKDALWETDIRIPMIIADLRTPAKKNCKRFVSMLDLFPTLCDYAGAEYPKFSDGSNYLDGFSLSPLMANPSAAWNRTLLTSYKNGKAVGDQGSCFPSYGVRSKDWHYIQYHTNGNTFPVSCSESTSQIEEELYHIGINKTIDPYEWYNVIDDPANASVVENLKKYLPGGEKYMQMGKEGEDVEISFEEETESLFAFPNPADNFISLNMQMHPGNALIEVTDILGNVIMHLPYQFNEDGFGIQDLNIKNLNPGYYLVKISQGAITKTCEFVVIR